MPIITMFPGGEPPATLPEFTYTGDYTLIDDGDGNWRIKLLTSGTLTFTDKGWLIDAFKVGGGGGGCWANNQYHGGAAGGYTNTHSSIVCEKSVGYPIVIGAGGARGFPGTAGGQTTAFGYAANGGEGGGEWVDANGGSGGGSRVGGDGGTNGGNGTGTNPGIGQGTTTKEFGEDAGDVYSPGGGGSNEADWSHGANGAGLSGANSGAGGYSCKPVSAGGQVGYSGIVVIRNHRAA